MVNFFKKAVSENHQPMGEIIPGLIKRMGAHYPERSHKVVHASDVTKATFCPRRYALMDVHGVEAPDQYIPTALRATFDVGNATSDLLREQWMGDMAVGNWRCARCGQVHLMSKKPVEKCSLSPTNEPCLFRYEEVRFVDPDTQVSGSIDVLTDLKGNSFFITEVKTINPTEFATLAAPLHEHRLRTALYLYLAEKSKSVFGGMVSHHHAKVLYISRGHGKKGEFGQITPFKEFSVHRDDKALEPILAKAKKIALFRQGKAAVPERELCASVDCVVAKGCPVRAQCFGAGA